MQQCQQNHSQLACNSQLAATLLTPGESVSVRACVRESRASAPNLAKLKSSRWHEQMYLPCESESNLAVTNGIAIDRVSRYSLGPQVCELAPASPSAAFSEH